MTLYGATLALAGFWANQQRRIDTTYGQRYWEHPLDAHECTLCEDEVAIQFWRWASRERDTVRAFHILNILPRVAIP